MEQKLSRYLRKRFLRSGVNFFTREIKNCLFLQNILENCNHIAALSGLLPICNLVYKTQAASSSKSLDLLKMLSWCSHISVWNQRREQKLTLINNNCTECFKPQWAEGETTTEWNVSVWSRCGSWTSFIERSKVSRLFLVVCHFSPVHSSTCFWIILTWTGVKIKKYMY